MALPGRIEGKARKLAVAACRVLGLCIFVAAFFLPAIRIPTTDAGVFDVDKGWECAETAIFFFFVLWGNFASTNLPFVNSGVTGFINMVLVFASGLVNILVGVILIFSFSRKSLATRRRLAIFSFAGLAATWIFFAVAGIRPLVGHYLWVAGALLIGLPDLLTRIGPHENTDAAPGTQS